MLTLNSVAARSFSAVPCVVCAAHESCRSVLVCESVLVHFFLCSDEGVEKVLLLIACMLDSSYKNISNIFSERKVQGMPCLVEGHFVSVSEFSVENKCIKRGTFPMTDIVSYVHVCLVSMWHVSSSLIKFCVRHSSSLFVSFPPFQEAQEGLR